MKKVYLKVLCFIGIIIVPASVIWLISFKVPKMIQNNDEYKNCQAQCHPNLVEQFTPCVCDTRYKHGDEENGHEK